MRLINKLKGMPRNLIVGVFVAVASVATGFALYTNANAANIVLNDGSECVKQSVIWCGSQDLATLQTKYKNGDGHNSAASIHNIYASPKFGITSTDIANMSKYAVAGSVTSDGKVYVGNELVATNAYTASRGTTSDSEKVTYNGTTFYIRHTRVSWYKPVTKAYVVMINGKFQFAVMGPCGNPIKATPKLPDYSILKDVRVKGSSTWLNSVSVKSNTRVEYRVTVKSTGAVSAKNIKVNDILPSNVQYVSSTLKRDGMAIGSSAFFGTGDTISSLSPGKTVTYTFEAIVAPNDTVYTCEAKTYVNTAKMSSAGLPSKSDTANVSKTCAAKPTYSCTSLTQKSLARDTFEFTAKAQADNGATITGYEYNFGDDNTKTETTSASTNTVSHKYSQAGTYTVTVTALVNANGTQRATSKECVTTVTVKEAAVAKCENLKLTLGDNRTVTATVTYTTSGGAVLKNIAYDFGDGTAVVNDTKTTVDHQYAKDGNYTVVATLSFTGGEVVDQECQASIGINTPAYSCDAFDVTKGDNRTVTVNKFSTSQSGGATYKEVRIDWGDGAMSEPAVKAIGQTHSYKADGTYTIVATAYFNVNDQTVSAPAGHCQTEVTFTTPETPPVTPPQVLPNTGAGDVIGFFGATTLAGGLLHRFFLRRKFEA